MWALARRRHQGIICSRNQGLCSRNQEEWIKEELSEAGKNGLSWMEESSENFSSGVRESEYDWLRYHLV